MTAETFRKKPVEVQAMQWTGENSAEAYSFTRGQFDSEKAGVAQVYDFLHDTWVWLDAGDWIIQGIQGEFYPCKQDIFAETYERVTK